MRLTCEARGKLPLALHPVPPIYNYNENKNDVVLIIRGKVSVPLQDLRPRRTTSVFLASIAPLPQVPFLFQIETENNVKMNKCSVSLFLGMTRGDAKFDDSTL